MVDPSSQRSTYVLVNPVSKVILFLAWQKKVKLFSKSQRQMTMIQPQKVNLKMIIMMTTLNLMLKHIIKIRKCKQCFDQKYHHWLILVLLLRIWLMNITTWSPRDHVIKCQYYQKQKEAKSKIHYRLLPKKFCLPDTGFITISEFNWKLRIINDYVIAYKVFTAYKVFCTICDIFIIFCSWISLFLSTNATLIELLLN